MTFKVYCGECHETYDQELFPRYLLSVCVPCTFIDYSLDDLVRHMTPTYLYDAKTGRLGNDILSELKERKANRDD